MRLCSRKISPSTVDVLQRLSPGRPEHVYAKIDFVIVVVACSLLGYPVYAAEDQGKALLAGLSAVALLKQVITWIMHRIRPRARI